MSKITARKFGERFTLVSGTQRYKFMVERGMKPELWPTNDEDLFEVRFRDPKHPDEPARCAWACDGYQHLGEGEGGAPAWCRYSSTQARESKIVVDAQIHAPVDPLPVALRNCSPAEARVIWRALDILLSDLDECIDEDDPLHPPEPELLAQREAARSVQARLDAAMCSLANDGD